MEKITGKNNDIIKGVKKLFTSSSQRREQGLFVLEGARLVFDVLNSFYQVEYFFITEQAHERYKAQSDEMLERSDKSFFISEDIASRLSETQNTQGVFAVCKMAENDFEINRNGKYIALDNIQDPGNLGTIIRTAEAFGLDGIIIGGGCDIYNPKVLRSSMGSVLRMNITLCKDLPLFLGNMKEKDIRLFSTTPLENAREITDVDFSGGSVCVIGNEANGVSREVLDACDEAVTVPMSGRAESLNASVAAAVIMWEMLR